MPEPDDTQHHDESNGNPEATAKDAVTSDSLLTPELSVSPNSIEGLFLQALQLPSPEEREAFLDRSCQNDPDNRRRVLALLRAHADAGDFMENPAVDRPANAPVSLGFLKPSDKERVLGTIGPYEVLEAIGRGGMGVVLRAMDPKLNRIVAVKALLPELASNPNSRRRFLREAQAAAAISHPHVVSIHAVDDSDQDHSGTPVPPFLVMECIVGQSLQQKLDKVGPLRLTEILRISRQISDGLAAAHKQGLVHRDIKPANILLENGVERVKITDFGLARAIDDITVTRTGEVCGTPQYMSPEQACGDRVDHRSDLFSLGCVMYAMCTGHSPFRGDSVAHVIKRVTQDEPRSIADQNPEIPAWLIEIINSLLQKKSEHRFQSAQDLATILDQHLSRIQHPSESGSHSAINEQVPYRKNAASRRYPESAAQSVPEFSPLSFLDRSARVLVPGWMRSASRIFAIGCVVAWILLGFTAMQGSLGIGPTEYSLVSFLSLGPFLMAVLLSRPTITREVMAIALFLGLGPLGLLVYLWIKDDLRLATTQTEHKIDTRWLNYRFAFHSVILVVVSMLLLPLLWLVSLAVRDTMNGHDLSILDQGFWTSVFAQKLPTLAVFGFVIAATLQTLLTIIERRKQHRLPSQASSQPELNTNAKPVDAPVAPVAPVTGSAAENVYMQFGQIITPVPLEAALHYKNVKSIGRAWILLTLVGVVLSLLLHPTLSLAANSMQLISQAFQYPASMLGIWIMSLLGTKIFTPTVPLRRWAMLSSTLLGCMALGYFWTTIVRMPFSGNLNEISSRSLMGAAIIPTMIFLTYCFWVYLEIIKNPEAMQEVRKLAGPKGLHSSRSYVVLVITIPLVLIGVSALLINTGFLSNLKPSAPPTVEVRKEEPFQSGSKKIASDDESTQ
jgi:serine/threonine protein kinase